MSTPHLQDQYSSTSCSLSTLLRFSRLHRHQFYSLIIFTHKHIIKQQIAEQTPTQKTLMSTPHLQDQYSSTSCSLSTLPRFSWLHRYQFYWLMSFTHKHIIKQRIAEQTNTKNIGCQLLTFKINTRQRLVHFQSFCYFLGSIRTNLIP